MALSGFISQKENLLSNVGERNLLTMTDRLISVLACANTVNPSIGLERQRCAGKTRFMIAKYGLFKFQYDFEPILISFFTN